jgi:hypothetical protein
MAGSPATEVATSAGGLAAAVGFTATGAGVGEGGLVGFGVAATGVGEALATALPFPGVAGFEVGAAPTVGVGAAVSVCDDWATGQQPLTRSKLSASTASRAARRIPEWYPARRPETDAMTTEVDHDTVSAAPSQEA